MITDTLAYAIGILSATGAAAVILTGFFLGKRREREVATPQRNDYWPEYRPLGRRWGLTLHLPQLPAVVIRITEGQRKRAERGLEWLPDYMVDENGDAREGEWI